MELFALDQPEKWEHLRLEVREVTPVAPIEERDLLRLVARVRWPKDHPIALAIGRELRARHVSPPEVGLDERWMPKPGFGLEGVWSGHRLLVGNEAMMNTFGVPLDDASRTILDCHRREGWTTLFVAGETWADESDPRHCSIVGAIGIGTPQPLEELPDPEVIAPQSQTKTSTQFKRYWPVALGLLCVSALAGAFASLLRVDQDETAVVFRGGRVVAVCPPGLYVRPFHVFERTERVRADRIEAMTIQADTIMTGDLYAQPLSESVPARSADQMVSAEAVVRYRVSDPVDWVILGGRGRRLLAQAARSVIREQIGYMTLDDAVGPKRSRLARHCTSHLRLTIDSLDLGAEVLDVGLVRVAPDEGTDELRVDEAFDAAEQASADHAEIVASARAEAERITSQARAGAALRVSAAQQREEQQIAAARAEAERFQALQEAFRNDPEGVKHALLLDLIGQRLQRGRVVVIDTDPDVPASQPASRPAAEGAAR